MKAHRMFVTSGLALASAAVLAAGAQAATRPDDRSGMIGVGSAQTTVAPPDAFERAALRHTSTAPPDVFERAVLRQSSVVVRPDDRAGARGPGASSPTVVAARSSVGGGFEWREALLGAAGIAFALGLAAVVGVTVRHRRRVVLR
jgi:hypothetical protein